MTDATRIATLLDEERPDWYDEVDTETLNMDDVGTCLLGQLYGSYLTGLGELGIMREEAFSYGVVVPDAIFEGRATDEFMEELFDRENVALRDDIVAEVEERRAAASEQKRELELTYA